LPISRAIKHESSRCHAGLSKNTIKTQRTVERGSLRYGKKIKVQEKVREKKVEIENTKISMNKVQITDL